VKGTRERSDEEKTKRTRGGKARKKPQRDEKEENASTKDLDKKGGRLVERPELGSRAKNQREIKLKSNVKKGVLQGKEKPPKRGRHSQRAVNAIIKENKTSFTTKQKRPRGGGEGITQHEQARGARRPGKGC